MPDGDSRDANDIGWAAHGSWRIWCGQLTPAEVIVAGTKTSAAILKLDDLDVAAGNSADLRADNRWTTSSTRKINKVYSRGAPSIDRR